MLFARVLAAAMKPALAVSAATATVGGGVYGWQHWRGDDTTAFERLQSAGQRLLIAEFGNDADVVIAVDPQDIAGSRTEVARIGHAPGWGIFASLAPDGGAIAYTALPEDADEPSPDSPAIAAIVEADGDVHTLASDIDLLIPPVWSPDAKSIVVRKNTPADDRAGNFELLLLGRDGTRSTITAWRSAAVFPIAFSSDGALFYFAALNGTGTDLYSVAPDGAAETLVAHLSDEIARDWRLSPDGTALAYTVAEGGAAPRIAAMRLDLTAGAAVEALPAPAGGDAQVNPAWRDDGSLTVASIASDGGGDAVSVAPDGEPETLADNDDSIDIPIEWAPDGSALAVRSVEGATALDAGESHVELLTPDGDRERVSEHTDVLIVGWME
jgi:Tol biopolymer transport system component